MSGRPWYLGGLAAALVAGPLTSQEPADSGRAAPGPPVRAIATASAVSVPLGSVAGVRELPGGKVLVNDVARRRLLVLDSTLQSAEIVLDSSSVTANFYGSRAGTLLPFAADSSLFVDPQSYAALVIDPTGRLARVRSVWNVAQIYSYTSFSGSTTQTSVDPAGRVIYQISATPERPKVAPPPGIPYIPPQPDSAFVIAFDLGTRRADTLGAVKIPTVDIQFTKRRDGSLSFNPKTNPLPIVDGWAALPDGTVAFVRGREYRIDFLHPDGTRTSSGRLPFPWIRLDDQEKDRLVDSVRTRLLDQGANAYVTAMIGWTSTSKRPYPKDFQVPAGFRLPPGLPKGTALPPGLTFPDNYLYACEEGQGPQITVGPGGAISVSSAGPAGGASAPAGATGATGAAGAAGRSAGETAGRAGGSAAATTPGQGDAVAAGQARPAQPGAAAAGAPPAAPPQEEMRMTFRSSAPGGAPPVPGEPGPGPGGSVTMVTRGAGPACVPSGPLYFGRQPPSPPSRNPAVVSPSDLPDYRPPIGPAAVRADADGNLWIRTLAKQPPGGTTFDIVSSEGVLTDRLQVPTGYTVVGFGKGRVVYLSMRDAAGVHLARVQLR